MEWDWSLPEGNSSSPPDVRLLWDELLSPAVPRALRELGLKATHIGHPTDPFVPSKGSSDLEVIEYASRANQVIVTSNHDMMMLCEEASQQFVWLDPRGKQLRKTEQALLVLSQIHWWAEILASDPAVCVRALRTKCGSIEAAEAVRLARQRMKAIERRRRTKGARPVGDLLV